MSSVAVSIATLGRPDRAPRVAESARPSVDSALHELRVVFMCSPGDDATIEACRATGEEVVVVPWAGGEKGEGAKSDWARKHNLAYSLMSEEWLLLGSDDIVFHPGWFDACLDAAAGISGGACVVGTNDLGNPRVKAGRHSTHPLVNSGYLACGGVIDDPTRIIPEVYGHWFCNPPDTPIWMSDCSFKKIGDMEVGDEVVGWTYESSDRRSVGTPLRTLCYSTVEKVGWRRSPLVRVEMESGRAFLCTPDHRWLNASWMPSLESRRSSSQWVTPAPGRSLLHVIDVPDPVSPDLAREAGWLAGIYDGEGSGFTVLSQNYTNNPEVIQRAHEYLRLLGIPYTYKERGTTGMADFMISGGRQAYLDFLLRVQPSRRRQLSALILGWRRRDSSRRERAPIGARRFGRLDRVVSVEPDRDGRHADVVSLTTTSGNYIAHGYASRNCDDEFCQTAQMRGAYVHAHGALVEHFHPAFGKAENDATYDLSQETVAADRALFNQRRRLWAR